MGQVEEGYTWQGWEQEYNIEPAVVEAELQFPKDLCNDDPENVFVLKQFNFKSFLILNMSPKKSEII